ncbi:hypothetical protein [Listeria booriae]|uniref:hypothetical protein n=1 Tax=Listeria booriae TaxID=1552123 RepID=UPI001627A9D2|nr:hypothetical protein [Listeria booriae]MBC1512218.1 hypothetical protein [Listeria booriae]MBC6150648.1 hypothetical protein [Listeria booriae]MBC6305161.1 hypothetical protein [Listeria booriae]
MRKVVMRLGQNIIKSVLYLSSFLPLFILLLIQNLQILDEKNKFMGLKAFFYQFHSDGYLSPAFIFWSVVAMFIILSILGILAFFKLYVKSVGVSSKVVGDTFRRADTLGYIVTYIVPLMSMDITSFRSLLLNFLLFFIIGVFYIKNNQFFMNPILNLSGYNILESDTGIVYITKLSPRKVKEKANEGEKIISINIVEDIYIIKEIKK